MTKTLRPVLARHSSTQSSSIGYQMGSNWLYRQGRNQTLFNWPGTSFAFSVRNSLVIWNNNSRDKFEVRVQFKKCIKERWYLTLNSITKQDPFAFPVLPLKTCHRQTLQSICILPVRVKEQPSTGPIKEILIFTLSTDFDAFTFSRN